MGQAGSRAGILAFHADACAIVFTDFSFLLCLLQTMVVTAAATTLMAMGMILVHVAEEAVQALDMGQLAEAMILRILEGMEKGAAAQAGEAQEVVGVEEVEEVEETEEGALDDGDWVFGTLLTASL